MSTTTIGFCVDMAERKILDESNDEYSEQSLLDLYHQAVFQIVNLVPSSHTEQINWRTAAGTRQVIPARGVNFADITRNMGADGQSPGKGIRETTLDVMKALLPAWESDTPSDVTEHFIRLPESKKNFLIYPPSTGNNYIEGMITTVPEPIVWDAQGDWKIVVIPFDDTYSSAIVNGMVYLAYDDDSDTPGNTPRSQVFYQRFLSDLGIREAKKQQYRKG